MLEYRFFWSVVFLFLALTSQSWAQAPVGLDWKSGAFWSNAGDRARSNANGTFADFEWSGIRRVLFNSSAHWKESTVKIPDSTILDIEKELADGAAQYKVLTRSEVCTVRVEFYEGSRRRIEAEDEVYRSQQNQSLSLQVTIDKEHADNLGNWEGQLAQCIGASLKMRDMEDRRKRRAGIGISSDPSRQTDEDIRDHCETNFPKPKRRQQTIEYTSPNAPPQEPGTVAAVGEKKTGKGYDVEYAICHALSEEEKKAIWDGFKGKDFFVRRAEEQAKAAEEQERHQREKDLKEIEKQYLPEGVSLALPSQSSRSEIRDARSPRGNQ